MSYTVTLYFDNIIVEHTTRKLYSPNPRIEVNIYYYGKEKCRLLFDA